MRVTLLKEELQKSLSRLQGVVEKRTIYPILSHVLISAGEDGIFIEATDLQISLKERVKGEIQQEGKVCLPARKFYEIVREMPHGELALSQEENFWVSLSSGRISLRMPGLDPADFPAFSSPGMDFFSINSGLLRKMIRKVAFCASSQESSMNLHGVLFEAEGDRLRLVATDGHRLALCERPVEVVWNEGSVVLPRKGMIEIRKVFHQEEVLKVYQAENLVQFTGGNSVLSVRILEGKFPEYRYVLPKGLENRTLLDRSLLLAALRRADVFASERGEGVRMDLSPEGVLELKAGGGDAGEFSEAVSVDYQGQPMSIMFNARYLIEALNVMDGERISLELRDSESAGLLKEEGSDEYLYLIMPMRMLE